MPERLDVRDPAVQQALGRPRRSKYGAIRTEVDGITFDSAKEAKRYEELRLLEQAGEICWLEVHPKFPMRIDGDLICTFVPDFSYYAMSGTRQRTIEDVKSKPTRTPVYRLKVKLLKALYGYDVTEV